MNLLKSILVIGYLLSLAVVAGRIGAEHFDAEETEQTTMEFSADRCNQFSDCYPNSSMPNGWTGRTASIGCWHHCFPSTLLRWPLSGYTLSRQWIPGLPSDIIVTEATIKLYCASRWGEISGSLFLAPVTGYWDSRVTYSKRPPIDTSQAIELEWPNANRWFEIDITSIAKQWYEGTLSNYGVQLYSTSCSTPTGGIEIRTPGWADSQYRPKLTIIYEPSIDEEDPDSEPGSIENVTATSSSSSDPNKDPENTINGSGLDANDLHSTEPTDMWLSGTEPLGAWIEYEFDKVYKLHQMLVWNSNQEIEPLAGSGLKDVTIEYSTNGTDYTTLGTTHEFARAPGVAGYAYNTTIDFGSVLVKYVKLTATSNWGGITPQYGLSEVRFLYVPVWAREPSPNSGATDVAVDVILGWHAGKEAVTHDVYISTDEQAVIGGTAPVVSVAEASYGPLSLDLGQTYYWRVDEVNGAETPMIWEGNIWNFTVVDHIIVDDFEGYNDLNPGDAESNRIFLTWIDGCQLPTNGATVGYNDPPFCERTIVHSGEQSMPLAYANTGTAAYSEVERTFAVTQDWTKAGIATLVLYFHGAEENTGQLYVKVNGSKVVYDGDAADIARPRWNRWNIDLASVGTNLQDVTKLSIGIDGNNASGTLYFDDILLYPPR